MNFRVRNRWAVFMVFLLCACSAGQSAVKMGEEPHNVREETIACYPENKRPAWLDNPPESDAAYDYFVGVSNKQSNEQAARDAAMRDAINKFVTYCGVDVKLVSVQVKTTEGSTSAVISSNLSGASREEHEAQAAVSRIKARKWYACKIRVFHDETPISGGWKASVLVLVPADEKDKVRSYARKIKEESKLQRRKKERLRLGELQGRLASAREYYLQARGLVSAGEMLQALSLLEQAREIIDECREREGFRKARQGMAQGAEDLDAALILRDKIIKGIALSKIGGDGQRLPLGQPLGEALEVKALCNYEGREVPLGAAQVEFSLADTLVSKVTTDREGVGKLAHYVFEKTEPGNITIIARLKAYKDKEVYFNLSLDERSVTEEAPDELSVQVSFLYEDNGVPKPMFDGMSLYSGRDFYWVYFIPRQDCYVYLYQVDSSGAVYQLFPNLEYSNAWNPVRADKSYWVPENDRFYLDDMVGEERIYLLASHEPAVEIENLFASLKVAADEQNQRELNSRLKGLLQEGVATRGPVAAKEGNPHQVKARSGEVFSVLGSRLSSTAPLFMHSIRFMHE